MLHAPFFFLVVCAAPDFNRAGWQRFSQGKRDAGTGTTTLQRLSPPRLRGRRSDWLPYVLRLLHALKKKEARQPLEA